MIPNYEITQTLASGVPNRWQQMYRGRRCRDSQPFLLKTNQVEAQELGQVDVLVQEFDLLQTCAGPGFLRAIEVSQPSDDNGCRYLVLEDCAGQPLAEQVAAGPLALSAFFAVALRLTDTLGALHRQNIVHRGLSSHCVWYQPSTAAVWLADLSTAVKAADEVQAGLPASILQTLLPYVAPEQTGRMNRASDYRTDFYSLGVLFYEMLTGHLPFVSTDALELIHWHIAKLPLLPTALNPQVPEPLSQLVMKLLAKSPEDRYQSALGLRADLERCADAWTAHGAVAAFTLGAHDVPERFLIPRKLYGREDAVAALVAGFERACQGQATLLLVAGYSGIGKTALIQELYKPIVRERGYFIAGKFDQVAQGMPFGALLQALRGLVRQWLGESEARLAQWRERLTAALGVNGGVLIEVIPELELIVGPQPTPPVVSPVEALNRFQAVFQQFISALARPEHPLVLFLDDLQWADAATLGLLQSLLSSPGLQALLLLGAYRENEVDEAHLLTRTLAGIRAAGLAIDSLTLGPLTMADLTRFVADVLHDEPHAVQPLAQLVGEKTAGNPFFVIQFLKRLKQEGFLRFEAQRGCWTYRLADIVGAAMTDNVVDFLTQKIQRLSARTQHVLALDACIGNQSPLALISEQPFEFWNVLTLAAQYSQVPAETQGEWLREMAEARRWFTVLAEHCPENYRFQALILTAELERLAATESSELAALALYEQALLHAEAVGLVQFQALANELSANLWLKRGQRKLAATFLNEARARYVQGGAHVKVQQLHTKYSELLGGLGPENQMSKVAGEKSVSAAGFANAAEGRLLDHFSVIKAAQAIASEIELEKLLTQLLCIAIENAGAERGSLLLEHAGAAFIHAEGSINATAVKLHDAIPLAQTAKLPVTLINYVRRTVETVVLTDAAHDEVYASDPYVLRWQPRSVLCVPVLNQGRLIGVLYLENNQATGVFTPERSLICQMLAAQAAISLANARLYEEMRAEVEQRRQAETTLRSIMEGTAALTGGDFFASLARHLAAAIPVKIVFVTECANLERTRARILAFWDGKGLVDAFEYDVRKTTCEKVYEGETCFYASELQRLFPEENALVALDGQSYIGLPVRNAAGQLIGHLAVIDDQPMDAPRGMDILKIFAARAGAELERMQAEAELRRALVEIEQLKNQLHAENIYLQEEIRHEHNFDEIVGSSPALLTVLHQIERIAPTDATVLILGETGTGKELLARAVHDRSARKERPLVKVNCGAISAGLVESELFGHVKGAFTGALDKRTGRFELADGGTLFLDEVGELPLETQVKLLRVLQEGEFEPVGSSKTRKVDVRIIAATNRNLAEEVKAGRFRADLFYRLNVLPLQTPPLRERREDIPQLAMFFLARFARRFARQVERLAPETLALMMRYRWPGNIRELQNLIERGVVLTPGPVLALDPSLLAQPNEQAQVAGIGVTLNTVTPQLASTVAPSVTPASASLNAMQRQHILNILTQTNWVIEGERGAAKLLNLHPNTLRSRMKKLGLQRPAGSTS